MGDRVHPGSESQPATPTPRSFVVKVPKEQILRVPSPETEKKFKEYTRRGKRKQGSNRCCRGLFWVGGSFLVFSILLGSVAGILYAVYRPRNPIFSIESLSAKLHTVQSGVAISPEVVLTVRAENPNKKIRIDYRGGGTAAIFYSGVQLCSGGWPAIFQGPGRVDVFQASLTGSNIKLSRSIADELQAALQRREVPLQIRSRVPVRIKMGALTTWTITFKLRCSLAVDSLAESSKVISRSCRVGVDVF